MPKAKRKRPDAKRPTRRGWSRRDLADLGLALASAVLWRFAFPRIDLWTLVFVALTPLFLMACRTTGARAALWTFLAAWPANAACIYWLRYTTWAGMLGLALLMSAYWVVAVLVIRWLRGRLGWPLVVVAGPVWVALEYFRSWLFTGFPWYYAGHALIPDRLLVQTADIVGAYGLSWLAVAVSALVADWGLARFRPSRSRWTWTGVVAGLLILGHVYGAVRLSQSSPRPGPRVLLVQANIPQDLKNAPKPGEDIEMFEDHVRLSLEGKHKVDLVVWPETMMPFPANWLFLVIPGVDYPKIAKWQARAVRDLGQIGRVTGGRLLIGSLTSEWGKDGKPRFCNSVYYISSTLRRLGRYDKMRLVIFGEYVPLKEIFPFFLNLRPAIMGPELSPGEEPVVFTLPFAGGKETARFAVTICYEDTVAPLVRRFAQPDVDILMNLTNDGWFRRSSELDMHLRICALRAVETRRPFVRSTNTGVSSIIDATGRVTQKLVVDGQDREVAGSLVGEVTLDSLRSPYLVIGDAVAALASVFAVAMVGVAPFRRRAKQA